MSEWQEVGLAALRVIPTFLFMACYVIGGRVNKWVRRFLGPLIFTTTCLAISLITGSFTPWLGLPLLLMPVALSMGYGADKLEKKVLRRGTYGLALGLCGFGVGVVTGSLDFAVFQLILAVLSSVYLGVSNPTSAVNEEALIGGLSVVCIPFMV